MYVTQLSKAQRSAIEIALRKNIKNTGLYTDDEVEHHVSQGLDSKIVDLTDTIDVYGIIKEVKDNISNYTI